MAFSQERYYRQITGTVLSWYAELESGVLVIDGVGRIFAPELINYRIDVEKALGGLTEAERTALMLVHRDGLSIKDAVTLASLTGSQPKSIMVGLEVRAGRLFERLKLNDLVSYLGR